MKNIKNVPEFRVRFLLMLIKRYRTNITATAIRCPLIYARNDIKAFTLKYHIPKKSEF